MSAELNVPETVVSLYLEIDGIHCEACVRRVRQALTRAAPGEIQQVDMGNAEVTARCATAPVLLAALAKAGFTARVRP